MTVCESLTFLLLESSSNLLINGLARHEEVRFCFYIIIGLVKDRFDQDKRNEDSFPKVWISVLHLFIY